jgi:thymidylate kinase
VDFVLGYWFRIFPLLAKYPIVVLMDRYFYDYYFDSARWGLTTSWRMLSVFEWLIPKPDLVVMLKPNAEVFHRRKPELPEEELQRQTERIYRLTTKLSQFKFKWIDTTGDIETSRNELCGYILDIFVSKRSTNRY